MYKGRKLEYNGERLFHNVNKTPEEMEIVRRTTRAAKVLRDYLEESNMAGADLTKEAWKQMSPLDWDMGVVRYRPGGTGRTWRAFEINREGNFTVATNLAEMGLGEAKETFARALDSLNKK